MCIRDSGYPVLVRPSYVLGGQGMQIAVNDQDVEEFMGIINQIAQEHPILIDKYLQGKEVDVYKRQDLRSWFLLR